MPQYVITNGMKCLGKKPKGGYMLVDENRAIVWNTHKQARKVLNKAIPQKFRGFFYVGTPFRSSNYKPIQNKPIETYTSECELILNKLIEADTSDFDRWIASLENFSQFVAVIEIVKSSLSKEMANADSEICDLLHYVEFSKLNASQGWAAAEMIKNTRMRRRKIKDALYIIDEIQRGTKNGIPENKSAQTAIFKLNTRTYTPRKLDFLFNGDALYFHYGSPPQQV